MKTILTTLLLALSLTTVKAQQFKRDKQLHFAAGMVVGAATHMIAKKYELSKVEEISLSIIMGIAVGSAKEFYDQVIGEGNVEFYDAGYTALGCVTMDVTLLTIKF